MIVNEIAKFENPPQTAHQLLGIAELVEQLFVLAEAVLRPARSR